MPRRNGSVSEEDLAQPFALTDAWMDQRAAALGLVADCPDDRTLQLDLDDETNLARMRGGLTLLASLGESHPCADLIDGEPVVRISRSGEGRHAWIRLKRALSVPERIALQAILGSDSSRELLSLAGHWNGRARPLCLFRPVGGGDFPPGYAAEEAT